MSETIHEVTIERILVALDPSPHCLAALEAAADLAAELRAELRGLFVEDVDLLRAAGLPFTREVTYSSAAQRRLDLRTMERMLRARAEEVRQEVATTAGRVRVRWSFQVRRGPLMPATLEAASEADLLILARESRPRVAPRPSGVKAPPLQVLYDGTPSGHRALVTAARLAGEHAEPLLVLVADPNARRAEVLRREALAWFAERGIKAVAHETPITEPSMLLQLARQSRSRLLLLNRDCHLLDAPTIETLVNKLDCPVGLVR